MFVYRATKHYEELWRVEETALLGHLRCLWAQATSKTMQEQIHRNPLWKRKIMSRELNILIQTMSQFIRDDQHMTVYQLSKGQILTPALKAIQWTRTEHLLQWHVHENILFMTRISSKHQGAVQPPEQDLCSKFP
jgi:hypothetical protein